MVNYPQKANEQVALAGAALEATADAVKGSATDKRLLKVAQLHATLAVAYATLAVKDEVRG